MIFTEVKNATSSFAVWNFTGQTWREVDSNLCFGAVLRPTQLQISVNRVYEDAQKYFQQEVFAQLDCDASVQDTLPCYRAVCHRVLKKLSIEPQNPKIHALTARHLRIVKSVLDNLARNSKLFLQERKGRDEDLIASIVVQPQLQAHVLERLSLNSPDTFLADFIKKISDCLQPMWSGFKTYFFCTSSAASSSVALDESSHLEHLHINDRLRVMSISSLVSSCVHSFLRGTPNKSSKIHTFDISKECASPLALSAEKRIHREASPSGVADPFVLSPIQTTPPSSPIGSKSRTQRLSTGAKLSPEVRKSLDTAPNIMRHVLGALREEFCSLNFLEAFFNSDHGPVLSLEEEKTVMRKQLEDAVKYQTLLADHGNQWHKTVSTTTASQLGDKNFLAHVKSVDLLSSHLVYMAPLFAAYFKTENPQPITFKISLPNGASPEYKCTNVFNLWRGVVCCSFEPTSDEAGPEFLALRGTQKYIGLPGFLGSITSVLHRFGPGANVLNHQTDGMSGLHHWLENKKNVVLSGHSLGGNIALDLFTRHPEKFQSVFTFASPGRNDRLLDRVILEKHSQESQQRAQDKVYQFVHARDPLSHIGSNWLGKTIVVDYDESAEPSSFADAIGMFHSCPLFLRDNLMLWEMEGLSNLMPGFQWTRFAHRVVGYMLSGPCLLFIHSADVALCILDVLCTHLGTKEQKEQLQKVHQRWLS